MPEVDGREGCWVGRAVEEVDISQETGEAMFEFNMFTGGIFQRPY